MTTALPDAIPMAKARILSPINVIKAVLKAVFMRVWFPEPYSWEMITETPIANPLAIETKTITIEAVLPTAANASCPSVLPTIIESARE